MKFKKGDKVIVKSKHGNPNRLYESSVYRYMIKFKVKYLYVNDYVYHIALKRYVYVINEKFTNVEDGDYFDEIDLEYYKPYERKIKLEKVYEISKII